MYIYFLETLIGFFQWKKNKAVKYLTSYHKFLKHFHFKIS